MSDEQTLERSFRFLVGLHARTEARKISWTEGSYVGRYATKLGEHELEISQNLDTNYPDSPDYQLVISERGGRVIETISNISMRKAMNKLTSGGLNSYALLQQIYEMARRQALNVDGVLDSLLDSLHEDE